MNAKPIASFSFLLGVALLTPAMAQEPAAAKKTIKPGCDRTAIQWFIPGQFEQARHKAKGRKRLLIIKGISFGVDDAGAVCATKGKW